MTPLLATLAALPPPVPMISMSPPYRRAAEYQCQLFVVCLECVETELHGEIAIPGQKHRRRDNIRLDRVVKTLG